MYFVIHFIVSYFKKTTNESKQIVKRTDAYKASTFHLNSSIEINTIYTVYMTVGDGRTVLINENFKSRVCEIIELQLTTTQLAQLKV